MGAGRYHRSTLRAPHPRRRAPMSQAFHADSSDLVTKEVLTWDLFGTASRELAQSIADSDFDPEIIIAVARGGLLPAGSLSYALGLKLADAINVEFYTDVHETLPDPVLLAPMLDTESIQGKRLLVVDDVADSGRTLALVLDLLREMGAAARSAVLYPKSASGATCGRMPSPHTSRCRRRPRVRGTGSRGRLGPSRPGGGRRRGPPRAPRAWAGATARSWSLRGRAIAPAPRRRWTAPPAPAE